MTKDQLAAELRKQGHGRIADMLDAEVAAQPAQQPWPFPEAPKKKAAAKAST